MENPENPATCHIGHTRRRQTKQRHNTICVGQCYVQTNTSNWWDVLDI